MSHLYPDHHHPVLVQAPRPGRARRTISEHPLAPPAYYHDYDNLPVGPVSAPIQHRALSVSGPRPSSLMVEPDAWNSYLPVQPYYHKRGSWQPVYDDDLYDDRVVRRRRSHSHAHSHSHSRSPSPYHDPDYHRRMIKLERLEKEEEEKAARERFEEEEMIKAEKKRRKEKEDEEHKKQWIAEWKVKEEEEKRKKKEKEEKENDAHREWAVQEFSRAGVDASSVEKILKRAEKSKERSRLDLPSHEVGRRAYVKVSRKYLETDTLDHYDLPWAKDVSDSNYIIIKQWIPEHQLDILFAHTDRIRIENRTELRKSRGKLALVEKKGKDRPRSLSRSRFWFLT